MNQTFYGVDINLKPKHLRGTQLHEQGKVIEINGGNSGASFYKLKDYDFYKRVMKNFADNTDGLILMNYDPELEYQRIPSGDMEKAREELYLEEKSRRKHIEVYLENNPLHNFYSIKEFLNERIEWKHNNANNFKRNQTGLYLRAAQELGLNIDTFGNIKSFSGLLKYRNKKLKGNSYSDFIFKDQGDNPIAQLRDGEIVPFEYSENYLPLEKLGLLWSNVCTTDEKLMGRDKFVNGVFEEEVLSNKALFYFYSQFLSPEKRELEKFLPSSFLYGLGLHTREGFNDWVKSTDSELFVQKPLRGSHGIGVNFLTRKQIDKYDRSPFLNSSSLAIKEGYKDLFMSIVLKEIDIHDLVIFQEAIPSQLITDEESGEKYPACARAIVQNGKFQGAIWRSNKKNGPDLTLTERLRHNITNGAQVMPVSDEDSRLLGEIAEASVESFEKTNESIKEKFSDKEVPYLQIFKDQHGVDMPFSFMLESFYFGKAKQAAESQGLNVSELLDQWEIDLGLNSGASSFLNQIKQFNDMI